MGVSCCSAIEEYPKLDLLKIDEEKVRLLKNKIGPVNFKDLFLESLSTEFINLFKANKNKFYAQSFLEGICKEYGLMGKSKDINEAFNIYKKGADFGYDYLCMYRLHRIFQVDYEKFKLKKNEELDRLYLYKCYAYIPYLIMSGQNYILHKINITYELQIYFDYLDNSKFSNVSKFLDFLKTNNTKFNIKQNDIKLIEKVILCMFDEDAKNDYSSLDYLLQIEKENEDDMAYYESQLKYCNFYIEYSGEKCDKKKVNDIFDKLINSEYYKAAYDYGRFLMQDEKYDEAKKFFKLGMDNSQQFCLGEYLYILLRANDLNHLLSEYKIASHFLNNLCLQICFEKLSISSFYYCIYYLTKHSSFKEQIKNNFNRYALEIFKKKEKLMSIENNDSMLNNFSENYQIENYMIFGRMCYYGIFDLIESNKEKSLDYFKEAYRLAKEKNYNFLMRINYLYIYKSRKYLFKKKKISLRKLNKTKEKLFRLYEETDEENLNSIELYNYYKLYKLNVIGNFQEKILRFLKKGKREKIIYNFMNFVYKEKCKAALEKEYSNTYLNQYDIILKNEFSESKDNITLNFRTTEGSNQYNISVPIDTQFIKVIHKLFNVYPELESKKIGTYICNANKISLFETVSENKLENGALILIIHQNSNNKMNYNAQDNDEKNLHKSINADNNIENLLSENNNNDENNENNNNEEEQIEIDEEIKSDSNSHNTNLDEEEQNQSEEINEEQSSRSSNNNFLIGEEKEKNSQSNEEENSLTNKNYKTETQINNLNHQKRKSSIKESEVYDSQSERRENEEKESEELSEEES